MKHSKTILNQISHVHKELFGSELFLNDSFRNILTQIILIVFSGSKDGNVSHLLPLVTLLFLTYI